MTAPARRWRQRARPWSRSAAAAERTLRTADSGDATPKRIVKVELSEPLGHISPHAGGRVYPEALCLVALHGAPIGEIALPLTTDTAEPARAGVGADAVARQIWSQLATEIRHHLDRDNLPVPDSLPPSGLPAAPDPACAATRAAVRLSPPPVSVVISTRERTASLQRCLDAILTLDYPNYEVVVVDNAPLTESTRELLAGDPYAGRVRYLREDRPGIAAAHNHGLAHAAGEIVAITDDDVIVDPRWLLELVSGFRLGDRVGCVTGLILPAELETPAQVVAERTWRFNKGLVPRVFDLSSDDGDPLYPYTAGRFGSGANMAFDAAALRELGGFDPTIGLGTPARGGDDLAAFFAVIVSGRQIVYNPSAIVHHFHHAEYAALKRQAFGYGAGLTAYLTKTALDDPRRALQMARLAGHGFRRVLDPRAEAPGLEESQWPADLARAERSGMLVGPGAYLRSRIAAARARRGSF